MRVGIGNCRACAAEVGSGRGSGLLALLLGLVLGGQRAGAAAAAAQPAPVLAALPALKALLTAAPAEAREDFAPVLTSGRQPPHALLPLLRA
jgi:hypothetical protein